MQRTCVIKNNDLAYYLSQHLPKKTKTLYKHLNTKNL